MKRELLKSLIVNLEYTDIEENKSLISTVTCFRWRDVTSVCSAGFLLAFSLPSFFLSAYMACRAFAVLNSFFF